MAKVYGTNNLDILDGFFDGVTDGDDTIFGLGGDDWIYGLDGNDILQGGEGADKLFGGDGIDTASYGDSPTAVYVNLQTGQGYYGTAAGDHLYSIENVTGSVFNDGLDGNDYDNVLSGGFGDDDLEGNGGADILNGGWGVDTANYSTSPAGVTVSGMPLPAVMPRAISLSASRTSSARITTMACLATTAPTRSRAWLAMTRF